MEDKNLTKEENNFLNKQVLNVSKLVKKEINEITSNINNDNEILLLGECTHGTREFYEKRADITKFMITNNNYKVILLEAEWPQIIRINKYIQNTGDDTCIEDAFSNINKFPKWLWKNDVIYELIEWLKEYNTNNKNDMVYIFGMDCQQFLQSMKFVKEYLKAINHPFYDKTNLSLAIFRQFLTESQYAIGAVHGAIKPMVHNIISNLQGLLSTFQWDYVDTFLNDPDKSKEDKIERLSCEQSFEIIVNGEEYFRKMLEEPAGSQASWNTRDQHMLMTIMRIRNRFEQIFGNIPKILVWAHNSHIGNSNATSRGGKTFNSNNTWNVGQMVKEMFPKSLAIGFYTYKGSVTAAKKDERDGITQELILSHPLSYENLFKNVCDNQKIDEFYLDLREYSKYNFDTNHINVKLHEYYRDIYTGEVFKTANVITEKNKMTYLISNENKKYLFINPYGSIVMRCRKLNSFDYSCNGELFNSNLLQRWIGVNYVKETEMDSHYGESKLAKQFDFVVFINNTNSLY